MKLMINFACLMFMGVFAASGIATAASGIFSSVPLSSAVTEAANYNGAINYTQGLWAPGGVSSATLTFFLKDDVSSNLSPLIDATEEWAKITSVTDGAQSLLSLPESVQVDPHIFVENQLILGHTVTLLEATLAASVGAENLFGYTPTLASYFNLDVSSLLNASNTGVLTFALGVDAKYSDIQFGSPANFAIAALTGVPLGQSISMFEDFIFDHAELTVNYTANVPEPSVLLLIGVGLLGLGRFRRKFVK